MQPDNTEASPQEAYGYELNGSKYTQHQREATHVQRLSSQCNSACRDCQGYCISRDRRDCKREKSA